MLISAGLIVLAMPIPFGAIMIVAGIVLLISASSAARDYVRSFRRQHRGANRMIRSVVDRLPDTWRDVLRRTDP